ncbi:MAG: DUF429 domain-containing protein [Egibacteraceae bacterium]
MSVEAVGVDGCPDGWVAVAVAAEGGVRETWVLSRLGELADLVGRVPVAVDIPIGLVDEPRRDADTAARRALRGAASSVFAAPPRRLVDALRAGEVADHAAASALSRATTGRGLSQQSWRLCAKIAEVDALLERGALDVHEAHPEVAFRALAGGTALARKRSYDGARQRLALLAEVGLEVPVGSAAGRAGTDDVLDASACAWVALGLAHGDGVVMLPGETAQRDHGRPVRIASRRRR